VPSTISQRNLLLTAAIALKDYTSALEADGEMAVRTRLEETLRQLPSEAEWYAALPEAMSAVGIYDRQIFEKGLRVILRNGSAHQILRYLLGGLRFSQQKADSPKLATETKAAAPHSPPPSARLSTTAPHHHNASQQSSHSIKPSEQLSSLSQLMQTLEKELKDAMPALTIIQLSQIAQAVGTLCHMLELATKNNEKALHHPHHNDPHHNYPHHTTTDSHHSTTTTTTTTTPLPQSLLPVTDHWGMSGINNQRLHEGWIAPLSDQLNNSVMTDNRDHKLPLWDSITKVIKAITPRNILETLLVKASLSGETYLKS